MPRSKGVELKRTRCIASNRRLVIAMCTLDEDIDVPRVPILENELYSGILIKLFDLISQMRRFKRLTDDNLRAGEVSAFSLKILRKFYASQRNLLTEVSEARLKEEERFEKWIMIKKIIDAVFYFSFIAVLVSSGYGFLSENHLIQAISSWSAPLITAIKAYSIGAFRKFFKKFDSYLILLDLVYLGLDKISENLTNVEVSIMKMEVCVSMKTEVQFSDLVVTYSAYSEELRRVYNKLQKEILMKVKAIGDIKLE